MRQALSLALVLLMVTQLGPAAFGADDVTSEITGMPTGTHIEVHLKTKQTLRGARGEVSSSGFTLLNPGAGDRQISFADITSVKRLDKKSHTTRNVLIVVGIAVVAVAIAVVIYAKHCPVGCGSY
jgi:hypothetical protein